jgi:hypothetical protein
LHFNTEGKHGGTSRTTTGEARTTRSRAYVVLRVYMISFLPREHLESLLTCTSHVLLISDNLSASSSRTARTDVGLGVVDHERGSPFCVRMAVITFYPLDGP